MILTRICCKAAVEREKEREKYRREIYIWSVGDTRTRVQVFKRWNAVEKFVYYCNVEQKHSTTTRL